MPDATPATAPVLTVTWDTVIGARHTGYDPDSGPEVEPVRLGEMVVDSIANTLLDEIRRDIRAEVLKVLTPAIQNEVRGIVREQLDGTVRKTNRWGDPEGDPQSLRDLFAAEVKAYLSESPRENRSGYSDHGARPGGFRELIKREIDDAMTKELRGAIREARTAVSVKVRDRAAEILADVVKAETRG